jgi:hypothetical protein
MFVYLSNNAAGPLVADWVRVDSYLTTSATFLSCVKDAGAPVSWNQLVWQGNVPAATSLAFQTRSSADTATWSPWANLSGSQIASPPNRYLEYTVAVVGTSQLSPELDSVTLSTLTASSTMAPSASPTAAVSASATRTPTATASNTTAASSPPTSSPTRTTTQTVTATAIASPTRTVSPTITRTPTPRK